MQNLTNLFSQVIKKNIELLSEKYNHQLFFHENIIFIKNEKNLIEIYYKTNEIISVKYNLEEGDLSEVNKKLSQLISDNKSFYDFGGNRILMEFYKNILILKDDICFAKSNVINLNNDKI